MVYVAATPAPPPPTAAPTPLPVPEPTPVPTPPPTITPLPTPVPTADDTVKLKVKFGISGAGACNLAVNYSDTIRYRISSKIKMKGSNTSIGESAVSGYDVEGCGTNFKGRRRRLLAKTATITLTYSASTSGTNYLTADGLYDAATESLSAAINDLTTELAAACGCAISVDTIKLELTTRTQPQATSP